jgi:hypothetical protein
MSAKTSFRRSRVGTFFMPLRGVLDPIREVNPGPFLDCRHVLIWRSGQHSLTMNDAAKPVPKKFSAGCVTSAS